MFSVLSLICGLVFTAHAYELPPNDGFVTDTVGILTADQEEQLETQLRAYQTGSGIEIAILIVDSLGSEPVANVAVQALRDWGVGNEDNNDGVLILHEYSTRNVFITTGYGAEGILPDLVIAGILDTDIVPNFRSGEYANGYLVAIASIKKHFSGEYTASRYSTPPHAFNSIWIWFIIVIQLFGSFMARSKSVWAGGLLGFIGGVIFVFIGGFWLAIPLLIVLGIVVDYILSNGTFGASTPRFGYRGFSSSSKKRSWRGFGGGTGGGGGAGRSY